MLQLVLVAPELDFLADFKLGGDFRVADLGHRFDLSEQAVPHENPSLVIGQHASQTGLLLILLEAEFAQIVTQLR